MLPVPDGLRPIGVVRSARTRLDDTPVQSSLNLDETAELVVAEGFETGLDGLEGFSHAWLVTWLGAGIEPGDPPRSLRQVPFLLGREPRELGVFAMRGPRRVNPLGLSLVRLVGIRGRVVTFAGVDVLDGTPVLDLKPYVARFDSPADDVRNGWFDDVTMPDRPAAATPHSLREP